METRPAYRPFLDPGDVLRRCSTCKEVKAAREFHFANKAKGERQRCCKPCKAEHSRRWYERHKDRQIDTVRALQRRKAAEVAAIVAELKAEPCTDCGRSFPPEAMDFDHVRGTKIAGISQLVRGSHSLEAVLAEIAKCELVCANCHRIRTARRRGSGGG
jgi:hypothetical protein